MERPLEKIAEALVQQVRKLTRNLNEQSMKEWKLNRKVKALRSKVRQLTSSKRKKK